MTEFDDHVTMRLILLLTRDISTVFQNKYSNILMVLLVIPTLNFNDSVSVKVSFGSSL